MNRFLSVLLSVLIILSCFIACTNQKQDAQTTEPVSTTEQATTRLTTDSAAIKDEAAINMVKSHSASELGLSNEDYKQCSFMVAKYGEAINGKNYVKVVATIKEKEIDDSGEEYYTLTNKGEYFISYDGAELISKNLDDGTYSAIK